MKSRPPTFFSMRNFRAEVLKLLAGIGILFFFTGTLSCKNQSDAVTPAQLDKARQISAGDILGNKDYPAISYGCYRNPTRDLQPTLEELKEDMLILHAKGIRVLRTYNVQLPQGSQKSLSTRPT